MTTQAVTLDYRPRPWQAEVHRRRRRFSVLAVHRRAGKTVQAVMGLIDAALRCDRDLGLFFYVAPQLKQAKAIAWAMLKQKVEPMRRAGVVDISEAELWVRLSHNGATIRIYGADNPDAMRGVRLDGVVLDEVAQMKPEVWEDIVQPALSDRLGWAQFIGTPQGVNLFSELFYKAQSAEAAGDPLWMARRYTVYDTDALPESEVERLRSSMSETSFAREYLCDFAASGDDQLISLALAQDAARRAYKEHDYRHAPCILGVDPARFGGDRSVIVRRRGLQMFQPIAMRGVDNMTLAARVAQEIATYQPDAVFIDAGAGSGVIDRLRQLGHQVIEVPFGGKAVKAHEFLNRRAEMWFEMRDWLESGGAIADDMALKQELATPTYWFDGSGRKVLESKDEIKTRLQGGGSPDIADALALTFAAPVQRKTDLDRVRDEYRPTRTRDYDPYA